MDTDKIIKWSMRFLFGAIAVILAGYMVLHVIALACGVGPTINIAWQLTVLILFVPVMLIAFVACEDMLKY